ncbi:glycosyltransferase family 2 protein [Candidatus Desantisbacteria bacterium]|nr:glycosyltransferase family 2 protein [Candidatus Desantisbacteria bacterium]
MEFIFWINLFLILYVYFGYIIILLLIKSVRKLNIDKKDYYPSVALLIGIYNEEKVIEEKIKNSLNLDYPREKIKIIIASDNSTDKSHDIIGKYKEKGVILYIARKRQGKVANFNDVIKNLDTEIVIFSDASSMYRSDTIKKLVRNFNDPYIGGVGGKVKYRNKSDTSVSKGEGIYWKLELLLRRLESETGSTIVVSGTCYAIRRSLFRSLPPNLPDDLINPLNVIAQGYRIVIDDETEIIEEIVTTIKGEIRARIRIVSLGIAAVFSNIKVLNPFFNFKAALSIWSHKLFRWLNFLNMLILFISNIFLTEKLFYYYIFILQLIFYSFAFIGYLLEKYNIRTKIFYIPFYFCLINFTAFLGILNYFRGKNSGIWEPVER